MGGYFQQWINTHLVLKWVLQQYCVCGIMREHVSLIQLVIFYIFLTINKFPVQSQINNKLIRYKYCVCIPSQVWQVCAIIVVQKWLKTCQWATLLYCFFTKSLGKAVCFQTAPKTNYHGHVFSLLRVVLCTADATVYTGEESYTYRALLISYAIYHNLLTLCYIYTL